MNKTMNSLILICCYLFGTAFLANTANAAEVQPSIAVTGTGEVLAKPDMARVNIGVVTQTASASDSLRQNSAAVEKVFATLDDHGIDEDDIQTSNFSIGPEYDYNRSGGPPRLVGYRVSNDVRVTVRNIARLGDLLDAVVSAGSNQVNGVAFEIGEAGALEDDARRRAMSDALRKANLYAQEAGVELGAVLKVEEMSGQVGGPPVAYAAMEQARAVPIAPGQQTVTQVVRVTYAIEASQ